MLTALKGPALIVAGVIVLAIVAAVTVLSWHGTLSGSDALTIFVSVLTAVTGTAGAVTAAHVLTVSANSSQSGPSTNPVVPPTAPTGSTEPMTTV